MTAAVAVAVVLLGVTLLPQGQGRPVAWRDLTTQVGPLTIADREHRLFQDPKQLDRFLARARARGAMPQVDFSRRQLLLVSPGPRSSTGYRVEVLNVKERGGEITVRVREQTPAVEDRVQARVTHPYRLLDLPARRDVAVDWIGR